MSANELREEIEQHQSAIQTKLETLHAFRKSIIEEIKPFIKTELKQNVDRAVINNPEHTKELGREKLSFMKQQLSDLLDRSDSLVEEIFSDDALWIYVNIGADGYGYTYDDAKNAIEKVNYGIKLVLGEAGKLLQNFGYSVAGRMYRMEAGSRRNLNIVSGRDLQVKFVYLGTVQTPKSLQTLIGNYAKEVAPLHQEYIDVLNLQDELQVQEAADLWNEL